jgi:hypothetical protein
VQQPRVLIVQEFLLSQKLLDEMEGVAAFHEEESPRKMLGFV